MHAWQKESREHVEIMTLLLKKAESIYREHIHIHHDNIALSVLVVAICCPFLPHRIEIFCSVSAFGLLKQTRRYRNKHAQNLQELKLARTETCKN